MKKFICIFISSILILAFIIGRWSDDSSDFIEEAYFVNSNDISDSAQNSILANKDVSLSNCRDSIDIDRTNDNPIIQNGCQEQILKRKAYTLSYNKNTKCPNWVAWHLTAEHADGDCPRDNSYYEDEEVPIPRATNDDYRGSGWSRGHMCPAGDNKWDAKAMQESNILTNICPQDRGLNSGVWNKIERDCRRWAKKYGDIYIVCGPIFLNREHETIGVNKVVVPEAFFKVILCLQGKPKAIGYVVRNNGGTKKRDMYVNTVDDVERITGIDFFPALPDSIENVVEAYANLENW